MAMWFDSGCRFLDGTHRSAATALSLPVRIAFWMCTDWTDQIIMAFQGQHSTRDRMIHVGMDILGQIYYERAFGLSSSTQTNAVNHGLTLTRNQWHLVVIEHLTTSSVTITIDGDFAAQVGSSTFNGTNLNGNIHIGASSDYGFGAPYYPQDNTTALGYFALANNFYRGYLAELTIWRGIGATAMTSAEHSQLYRMQRPLKYFQRSNVNVYMPLNDSDIDDQVNLDTVAGGSPAFWNTKPALVNRYCSYVEDLQDAGTPNILSDGDTITVGTGGAAIVYTFKNTLTGAANEVRINGNLTMHYLAAAIENSGGAGTDYGTGTTAHTTCMAVEDFGRGNNNNYAALIQQKATGAGTAENLSWVTASGSPLVDYNLDGTAGPGTTLGALQTGILRKRPTWWWDNSTALDLGAGANNHAHAPPVRYEREFARKRPIFKSSAAGLKTVFLGRLAGMSDVVLAHTSQ